MIGKNLRKITQQLLLMVCMLKKICFLLMFQKRNREKQVILLMIPNREGQCHYLAIKKLSALLRGLTSKNNGDFNCLNCFHSFRTKNKLESHKKVCENKDFCNIIMSSEDTKILEFNQYQKPDKAPFIIYADLECTIQKIDGCKK